MIYADDTLPYGTSSKAVDITSKLELCIAEIRDWMRTNRLVLNDSKTEIITFHSKFRKYESIDGVQVGEAVVKCCSSVRDLGFCFDEQATMATHVANTCKSHALYKIGGVRKFLDQKNYERLVHAFITSRLDYCNSMLYGLLVSHLSSPAPSKFCCTTCHSHPNT